MFQEHFICPICKEAFYLDARFTRPMNYLETKWVLLAQRFWAVDVASHKLDCVTERVMSHVRR